MSYVILLFGFLVLLLGIVILVKPDSVLSLFRKNSESNGLYDLAVIARLILGITLLIYADQSKYPLALQILGWLSVTAAIILLAIGRSRFKKLITWVLDLALTFMRIAGLFAILLGGFLIYAVA